MGKDGDKGDETGMQGGKNAPRERNRDPNEKTIIDTEGEPAEDYERSEDSYSREPEDPKDKEKDADGVKG